jgi:hypothetical protein
VIKWPKKQNQQNQQNQNQRARVPQRKGKSQASRFDLVKIN